MPSILDEVTFRKLVIRALIVIIYILCRRADLASANNVLQDLHESLGE